MQDTTNARPTAETARGENSVGVLLHDVARLVRLRFDQQAQVSGLTRAQWHVLASLKRNQGISQAGLAKYMGIEPITLSRHIDRLEKAGIARREPDPDDRRAHRLYLGAEVQPKLDEMRRLAGEIFGEALSGVGQADIDTFVAVLSAMRANLSTGGADATATTPRETEVA